jgi:hypothetical protein
VTLDTYLVRHDKREIFHLCDHRSAWSQVFPITGGAENKIQRFGAHLLGQLPALLEKARAYEAEMDRHFAVPAAPDDFDLAAFDAEIIRRIRAWAEGAPGVYAILDNGDHMDFVYQNHYRCTGTGYARRVGSWWLDTYEWSEDVPPVAWLAARRDDGAELKMAFPWGHEAAKVYHHCTTLELEAALEQNPRRARA